MKTPTSQSFKVVLSSFEILVGVFILLTMYLSYIFCFSSFECCVLEPEGDKPLLAGISQSIFSLELEFSVCSTVG